MDTSTQIPAENTKESGSLVVQVVTAGGALPLEGAAVTVSDETGEWINESITVTTSPGGLTPRIFLPTPPRALSMSPSADVPYSLYNIAVSVPGYFPYTAKNVPVFSGVNSFQIVRLIPIAPYESSDTYPRIFSNITEKENELLRPANQEQ